MNSLFTDNNSGQHQPYNTLRAIKPTVTDAMDERCRSCVNKLACEAAKLLTVLPPNDRKQLFRTHIIPKGQHLYYAGDPLDTLAVVKTGVFKTYLTSKNGDDQVMGFHMQGEVLGADGIVQFRHSLSAVALETATICSAPYSRLENLAKRHDNNWLLRQVHQEVLRDRRILMITARRHSADAKLALFLLDWSARSKAMGYSPSVFKMNVAHRDIGQYLDMAVETVSRAFARLQQGGLIEIHRPNIILKGIDGLQLIAEL
jgi:CRP/FNR family transcriptional regulator